MNIKLLVFTVFLLVGQSLLAQGIDFEKGSWEEIKAKAKAENKYIFVDAYASWCGPCIWMTKNTFLEEDVTQFYNKNFINYKLDMEKGEGPTFQREYGVRAYPTFLYFNPKGELIHKTMGAKLSPQLIEEGKQALKLKE